MYFNNGLEIFTVYMSLFVFIFISIDIGLFAFVFVVIDLFAKVLKQVNNWQVYFFLTIFSSKLSNVSWLIRMFISMIVILGSLIDLFVLLLSSKHCYFMSV